MIDVRQGDASQWKGSPREVDLIFTHPYAPLPKVLQGKPAIINLYHPPAKSKAMRQGQAEAWIGGNLEPVAYWGHGHRNITYISRLPFREIDLSDLVEDEYEPGIGWFPLEMTLRLLRAYRHSIPRDGTIWDGFCGRGTVGKACQILGYGYIGLDIDAKRVELARQYLEI